jgi:hypothetical protein
MGSAMRNHDLYAVVTGDIISSSKFKAKQHEHLLSALKSSFRTIEEIWPNIICAPFEIYRGDSFQGVLSKPEKALHAAIVIRASLRRHFQIKRRRDIVDARIVVGIGSIASLPHDRVAEGDGEAFRRSGPVLDEIEKGWLRKQVRLLILTPWQEIDAELDVECTLLDALINRWSAEQAESILGQIKGLTQTAAAKKFGISQSANSQRLIDAGGRAVRKLCRRYEKMIRRAEKRNNLYKKTV